MSRRTAQRVLWIAFLFLVPVPLLTFGAFVPTMRLLELTTVIVITIVVEGGHGVALLLLGLFAAHTLVFALLLWIAARILAGLLERIAPAAIGVVTLALVASGLVAAVAVPVYDSPFHARLPHTTLLEVYQ